MKQIFPKEIVEGTVEAHQFKHSNNSKVLYAIILVVIIAIIAALPFIKVDIYTSSPGLIKPDKERLTITSLNSGKVISTNLKNNNSVKKGDTLLVLNNSIITEKLKLADLQTNETNTFINDLSYLIDNHRSQNHKIVSPKYKKEHLLYKQKLQESYTRKQKLKRDFQRSKTLFEKDVISKVEFENVKFDLDLVGITISQLKRQQLNTWQATLTEYKNSLSEIKSTKNQLLENKSEFVMIAPISGTLIGVKSIENGSFINTGEAFANISPNTALLVECFISPQDIGLLNIGNEVNFQVDAYNYNQWGLASGNVIEIGKDIELVNNTPAFKVLCHLNEKDLSLKNGFKVQLKKGMTLNAQFKLAERTLFDLLYDKVDDWVNPSQKELATTN